jgi:hypothetical protein
VLLGGDTHRLVRDAVEVEPVAPLEAKGKADPVEAFRLLGVKAAATRRHAAPMVGRERQLRLLQGAFANVAAELSCQLFTVLGTAGVGKSRLVAEFLRSLEGATVVRGRCLSYGEGISYWPVTEVVKRLLPEGAGVGATAPLASILGDDSAAGSPDEIAWAFRKLLEARVTECPLVVVFDDIHSGFGSGSGSRTFMRGIQRTDANGLARFRAVYPGWYQGRTVHIHVKVHVAGNVVHTGQLYFPDSLTDRVFRRKPYNRRGRRTTRNANDSVFVNGGKRSMLSLRKSGGAYVAAITMGVHRS